MVFYSSPVRLHEVKHTIKIVLLVASICLINVIISSTIFLPLSFVFPWLFSNDTSDNRVLSSNLAIVSEWRSVIIFNRVYTIKPYPCVVYLWMRILSDDYFELLFIYLSQERNYRFEGRTANCIFFVCVWEIQCVDAQRYIANTVFAAVSTLKQEDCFIRWAWMSRYIV